MSVKPDQIIVYMGDNEKERVREVAYRLGMSQSALIRALAFPQIRKLHKVLQAGADPGQLKKKLLG